MNKPLFGTSGVRGVVNRDLTPGLCMNVGRALGSTLRAGSAVCIATDPRLSRELIKNAVTEGLTQSGINVADIGIAPTPALALLTREMEFDAGVMITASHNPPEFNGIKLFNKDCIGYSRAQEQEIEDAYYAAKFRTGQSGVVESVPGMKEKYFTFLQSHIKDFNFNLGIKIMVDPGNGAAAGFAGEMLKRAGFNVIPVNDLPDGRFPGRSSEPKEDTLQGTIKFLRQKNADLAICFDGDADRVVFCDQKGFLGFNEMIAFIARSAVRSSGRKTVATTVETGMLLDLAVKDLQGKVIRGKVGDVHAAHLARDNNAAIGVESVGVYILPEVGYYPDSIFAALTLLGSIRDVSEVRGFIASLPQLFFYKDKVACPSEAKETVMQAVKDKIVSAGAGSLNELDGLRLEFADAWMLIRASGTEPAIRVLVESGSTARARSLLTSGMAAVEEAIKKEVKA
jgi:phosphoglucosamine mutase